MQSSETEASESHEISNTGKQFWWCGMLVHCVAMTCWKELPKLYNVSGTNGTNADDSGFYPVDMNVTKW